MVNLVGFGPMTELKPQYTQYNTMTMNHSPLTFFQKNQAWLNVGIFLISLLATAGSLYYSTFGDPVANYLAGNMLPFGNGLTPCVLCWFARIFMYPIVIISYVGMIKNDRRGTDYVLPLALMGIVLETYHYALQKLPIQSFFTCTNANPCNALQVNYFGFVTIPFLALLAFVGITVLAVFNTYLNHQSDRNR